MCKEVMQANSKKEKKSLMKKMAEDLNSYFSKEENQWPTGT